MVFDVLRHVGTRVGWGRDDGVLIAADIQDLCIRIAIAPEEARSLDPLSFLDDDGTCVAPLGGDRAFRPACRGGHSR